MMKLVSGSYHSSENTYLPQIKHLAHTELHTVRKLPRVYFCEVADYEGEKSKTA